MRRVGPWSGIDKVSSRSIFIVTILTLIVSSSIAVRSSAKDGSSSISANCDECHKPSIYLVVEIQFIDAPELFIKNESTMINVTIEVSGSHKSNVWSGFGMDVWLAPGTDHTNCGPHQIINGQKPRGSSSPYSWKETFTFWINSSLEGLETLTVNARMSPIHESPPVTATDQTTIFVTSNKNGTFIPPEGPDLGNIVDPAPGSKGSAGPGSIGIFILILGALAVIGALAYVVYTLISPVDKGEGSR